GTTPLYPPAWGALPPHIPPRGTTQRPRPRAVVRLDPRGCCKAVVLRSSTQAVSWAREENPSLVKTCSTWESTVRLERYSRSAISRLPRPSATSSATSRSRLVSDLPPRPGSAVPPGGP